MILKKNMKLGNKLYLILFYFFFLKFFIAEEKITTTPLINIEEINQVLRRLEENENISLIKI